MSKIYAVTMPKWGIEMEEGTITAWLLEAGTEIEKGVDLIDIETSKIVNTLEAPYSGVLKRCIANVDDTLNVGALLGVIGEAAATDAEVDEFIASFKPVDASFEVGDEVEKSSEESMSDVPLANRPDSTRSGKTRVSPPVRRLAESLGVDLAVLSAGGGRVTKQMVEDAAAGMPAEKSIVGGETAADDIKVVPMTQRRKTIAARLVEAKTTIPHYYLTADYNLDALLNQREKLNFDASEKISINDMLVQAVAKALQAEPGVNVTLVGDDIHHHSQVNISVAIATDYGLVAPTLMSVQTLDIHQITAGVRDLAKRALDKTLVASDLEHGTFTISNLGMYGLNSFQAIINPPQGAILAVGGVEPRAIVEKGQVKVANMLTVNLSCDHRIIDGAVGAAFLKALRAEIEDV